MIETLATGLTLYVSLGFALGVSWTLALYWPHPFEPHMIPLGIAGTLAVTLLWPLFVLMGLGIAASWVLIKLSGGQIQPQLKWRARI